MPKGFALVETDLGEHFWVRHANGDQHINEFLGLLDPLSFACFRKNERTIKGWSNNLQLPDHILLCEFIEPLHRAMYWHGQRWIYTTSDYQVYLKKKGNTFWPENKFIRKTEQAENCWSNVAKVINAALILREYAVNLAGKEWMFNAERALLDLGAFIRTLHLAKQRYARRIRICIV